jgi:hypothetical protein
MLRSATRSTGWPMEHRASVEGGSGGATFLGCRCSRLRPEAASLCFEQCHARSFGRWSPRASELAIA